MKEIKGIETTLKEGECIKIKYGNEYKIFAYLNNTLVNIEDK